jgi:WD40 repeat protein
MAVVGYTGLVHDSSTVGVSLFKYNAGSYTQLTPILWDRAVRVCYSPDGDHLAIGGSLSSETSNFIRVYKRGGDTYSLIFSESMTGSENVWDIEYSPDGTHMILGTNAPFYEGDKALSLFLRSGDSYTRVSQASNPFPSIGGNTCYYVTAKSDKVFASSNGNTTRVYVRAGNSYTLLQSIAIGGSFIEPAVTDDGLTLVLNNTVYTFNGTTYVSSGVVTGTSGTKAIAKFDKDDRLFLGTQTALYLLERSGADYVVTSTAGLPAEWINALGLYPRTN